MHQYDPHWHHHHHHHHHHPNLTGRRRVDKIMRWSLVAIAVALALLLVYEVRGRDDPKFTRRRGKRSVDQPPASLRHQIRGPASERPRVILGMVSSPRLGPLLDATVGSCSGARRLRDEMKPQTVFGHDWAMAVEAASGGGGLPASARIGGANLAREDFVYLHLPRELVDPMFGTAFSDMLGALAMGGYRVDLVVVREYLGTSLQVPGASIHRAMESARDMHHALGVVRSAADGYAIGVLRAHDRRLEDLLHSDQKGLRRWLRTDLELQWKPQKGEMAAAVRELATSPDHRKHHEGERQAISSLLRWISERSLNALKGLPSLPHLVRWRSPEQERKQPTRIVIITQVRNVAHTLESFLGSVLWAADRILLLDTGSTDGTVEIVQRLAASPKYEGKVAIRRCSHGVMGWNEGRSYRELLDWARKEERATHVMCPDSDEYPTQNWRRHDLLRHAVLSLPPKTALTLRLFHVYNGTGQWISPSPPRWQQAEKAPIAWHDDGRSHRGRNMHHISRVPVGYGSIALMKTPGSLGSVHFKFASLQAIGAKTLWYRHLEYDSGSKARALGPFYANKMPRIRGTNLKAVPLEEWYGPHSERWTPRWTEPESWGWRVRMVQDWRAAWKKKGQRVPKPLALPPDWPFGVRLVAGQGDPHVHEHEHAHHHDHEPQTKSVDDALERRCRDRRARGQGKVAELLPVAEGPLRFLWAVAPDRTIPRWLHNHERHVREFALRALSAGNCLANGTTGRRRGLVVDVGANSGYYGLMALAAGCRTLFVDPQPYCGMLLDASVAANGWDGRACVLRAAAGDQDQAEAMDVWCDTPCYGRVGAPGVGAPKKTPTQPRDGTRPMVKLSDHEWLANDKEDLEITMLKVDVEGAEATVLRGLWSLFERRAVRAATIEVTPMFYRQLRRGTEMRQEIWREMERIAGAGYEVWAPRTNGEPKSYGDYRRLKDGKALRKYLLDAGFKQHDVFLYRK